MILAIDQGTQSSRVILFDKHGKQLASAKHKISLNRIDRHHVEQDGQEILQSVIKCIDKVVNQPEIIKSKIIAAGMATQRSSIIAWDKYTGLTLSPVLSWQDRREWQWLESIQDQADDIKQKTGLRLTPHYGASKLRWLLNNNEKVQYAAKNDSLLFGPLSAYLLFNLLESSNALVDHANASRTQLWNIAYRDWDDSLLDLFDIDNKFLPTTMPIRYNYGKLKNHNIPLTAVNGDQTAAIYAQGKVKSRTAIINIGTGAFVLKPTADKIIKHSSLLCGLSDNSQNANSYLIEGTVNGAGAAFKWTAENLKIEILPTTIDKALKKINQPNLIFINTVAGLGSPWWADGSTPHWVNLTGEIIDRPDPTQALVSIAESIIFMLWKNLQIMLELGQKIDLLLLSGGLANNNSICQKLCDLSNIRIARSSQPEATAKGIAWLAAACPENWQTDKMTEFIPTTDIALGHRYNKFLDFIKEDL